MRSAVVFALMGACMDRGAPATFRAPGILRQALASISELEATTQLVPEGAPPLDPIPLSRGEDGVSFTGFIAAAPGTYTLEIAFTGTFGGTSERRFFGRWTSDAFTVTEGDAVSPVFSRPLDTIGRPEDGGDVDADDLGLLDELLWSADPTKSDSDGDGVRDGNDCDPTDADETYPISGSIEDCDGDGALRMDIPYKPGGTDCDDRDPAKQTCPIDDREGPSISILDPMPGETVGCHRRIRARITDPSGVDLREALFVSASGAIEATIGMRPDGSDQYITNQFDIATDYFLEDGIQRYRVLAADGRGNTSTAAAEMTFALEVPVVTMMPSAIGQLDLPLDVRIEASSSHGIAQIALMRALWSGGAGVDRSGEVEIGRAMQSPATIRIDPAMISEGRYAVYAIATDMVGNQSKPELTFSPELGAGGLATDADFLCIFESGSLNVPVRELIVGMPAPTVMPAKMRDHLDEAIAMAAQRDPNALLVEIRGWGMEADGYIRLDQDALGQGKWWQYEFFNAAEMRFIAITWDSAYYGPDNPDVVVQENYAFTPEPIMASAADLVDSDVAAAAFTAAGCPALVGDMNDDIRWISDLPFTTNDVLRVSVGDVTWKATAVQPITEIAGWNCP